MGSDFIRLFIKNELQFVEVTETFPQKERGTDGVKHGNRVLEDRVDLEQFFVDQPVCPGW